MNQDPKQHWRSEVAVRRAKLDHIRSALRIARHRHLETGAEVDAGNVTRFAESERLADEALTYAEVQLERASQPQRVIIHSSREALGQRRRELEQRIAYRDRQYEERVAHERLACSRMPEHHFKIHLQNTLGAADFGRKRDNAVDQKLIDDCNAQLAEYRRQDAEAVAALPTNQPHDAA